MTFKEFLEPVPGRCPFCDDVLPPRVRASGSSRVICAKPECKVAYRNAYWAFYSGRHQEQGLTARGEPRKRPNVMRGDL